MELNVYSIYDTAAKAFATPFFVPNDGLAIRAFSDNVNSPESQINKHPEQFILYKIGTFSDHDAKLDHFDPVVNMGTALTFLTETPEKSALDDLNHKVDTLMEKILCKA